MKGSKKKADEYEKWTAFMKEVWAGDPDGESVFEDATDEESALTPPEWEARWNDEAELELRVRDLECALMERRAEIRAMRRLLSRFAHFEDGFVINGRCEDCAKDTKECVRLGECRFKLDAEIWAKEMTGTSAEDPPKVVELPSLTSLMAMPVDEGARETTLRVIAERETRDARIRNAVSGGARELVEGGGKPEEHALILNRHDYETLSRHPDVESLPSGMALKFQDFIVERSDENKPPYFKKRG